MLYLKLEHSINVPPPGTQLMMSNNKKKMPMIIKEKSKSRYGRWVWLSCLVGLLIWVIKVALDSVWDWCGYSSEKVDLEWINNGETLD